MSVPADILQQLARQAINQPPAELSLAQAEQPDAEQAPNRTEPEYEYNADLPPSLQPEGLTPPPAETPQPAIEKYRVKVDGNEVEVTLDELMQGYSRTSDYTLKTQALAERKRQLDERETNFMQVFDHFKGKMATQSDLAKNEETRKPILDPDVYEPELVGVIDNVANRLSAFEQRQAQAETNAQAAFVSNYVAGKHKEVFGKDMSADEQAAFVRNVANTGVSIYNQQAIDSVYYGTFIDQIQERAKSAVAAQRQQDVRDGVLSRTAGPASTVAPQTPIALPKGASTADRYDAAKEALLKKHGW